MSCTCGKCTSTIRICEQTVVPQVDNTALDCADCGFVKTACVIHPEAIAYLGLPENTDLNTLLDAFLSSLIDARNRIEILEP